jgi:peptide/nickel transport system permease protein
LGLLGYVIRRAVYSVLLVFGAVILVFFLTRVAAPNPAALWAGPRAPPSVVQAVVKQYHLDQPVYVQLIYYLEEIFTFNFGISPFFKQPIANLVSLYFPRTLELAFFAMVLTVVIGVFTGAYGAAHKDRKGDYGARGIYLVTWSMPPFLVALLLQFVFAYQWSLLPSSLLADPALSPPKAVTGFPLIDSLVAGNYTFFSSALTHLASPGPGGDILRSDNAHNPILDAGVFAVGIRQDSHHEGRGNTEGRLRPRAEKLPSACDNRNRSDLRLRSCRGGGSRGDIRI